MKETIFHVAGGRGVTGLDGDALTRHGLSGEDWERAARSHRRRVSTFTFGGLTLLALAFSAVVVVCLRFWSA